LSKPFWRLNQSVNEFFCLISHVIVCVHSECKDVACTYHEHTQGHFAQHCESLRPLPRGCDGRPIILQGRRSIDTLHNQRLGTRGQSKNKWSMNEVNHTDTDSSQQQPAASSQRTTGSGQQRCTWTTPIEFVFDTKAYVPNG
jgi:hypothetical protein